jgi:hypothetical protein
LFVVVVTETGVGAREATGEDTGEGTEEGIIEETMEGVDVFELDGGMVDFLDPLAKK